jgi:hypothetical protein
MNASVARKHSEKLVVVSYSGGETVEVWNLRFNRGSKMNKPVKFFADLAWKHGTGGVSYSGTRWDFPSEHEAESWFAAGVSERGGEVKFATPQALNELKELGYRAT